MKTLITYLILVILAITHWIFAPIQAFSMLERRPFQTTIDFSLEAILTNKTQKQSQNYLDDQFFLRDLWVQSYHLFQYGFNQKWLSDVIIGKNGQLYHDFIFDNKKLLHNLQMLEHFKTKYPEFEQVVVPVGLSFYKQDYPNWLVLIDSSWHQNESINGLYKHLLNHGDASLLYKTDHHLSHLATIEFIEYIKTIQPDWVKNDHVSLLFCNTFFGTLAPHAITPFTKPDTLYIWNSEIDTMILPNKTVNQLHDLDSCDSIDPYSSLMHGNHGFISITTNANNGKKLLVIKDSHAHQLIPFLTQSFSQIDVIDYRYNESILSDWISSNDYDSFLLFIGEQTLRDERWFYKLLR